MDMNTSYIAPTIVVDVTEDDKLMQVINLLTGTEISKTFPQIFLVLTL